MRPDDLTHAHEELDKSAVGALLTWLDHASVQPVVDALRGEFIDDVIAPVEGQLRDQAGVCSFLEFCLGVVRFLPNGTEEENPFELWTRTTRDFDAISLVAENVRRVLAILAGQLANAGAPMDPTAVANQYALGQLLLLAVDLGVPAREWVDSLNVLPIGSFGESGNPVVTTRHETPTARKALFVIRSAHRERLGLAVIEPPYAGGRPRQTRQPVRKMAEAFAVLVSEFPSATNREIVRTWRNSGNSTEGGRLRQLLGSKQDSSPPSATTVRRYLRNAKRGD